MQLARTLHSQATEKSFFVLSLNTWNKLSEDGMGGASLGPQWRGGFQDPITSLPAEGLPPKSFSRLRVAQFHWNLPLAGAIWQSEPNIYMGG